MTLVPAFTPHPPPPHVSTWAPCTMGRSCIFRIALRNLYNSCRVPGLLARPSLLSSSVHSHHQLGCLPFRVLFSPSLRCRRLFLIFNPG
ncbi:hypothetical protein N656DRAFT_169020 [Canariomyces notabilis]|uniref:Uncharacterized protein n=1 Tax=Canariomyces notabilis TaxID=2074819 RepID=A0AAN6QN39_9PEZI|nr:hypothetical protein N656DRAFT_169020 [Canariomyces arenarius]